MDVINCTKTYAELGQLEPEHEDGLEREIPREVVKDDTQGEALQKVEKAEDDPVREPLHVILDTWALDCLEGEISRQAPADEVGDWCSGCVDQKEERKEENRADSSISLWHLSALFERVQNRILRQLRHMALSVQRKPSKKLAYLLVELADIVVGFVGGLLESRMLLNFLRSGHLWPRDQQEQVALVNERTKNTHTTSNSPRKKKLRSLQ